MLTLQQRITNIETRINETKYKLNRLYDDNEGLTDTEFLELEELYNSEIRELESRIYDLEYELEFNEVFPA